MDGATGDPTEVWMQRLEYNDIEIQNYMSGNEVKLEGLDLSKMLLSAKIIQ